MKIVVTGGCGFIGSVTACLLRDAGHDVLALDDMSDKAPGAVAALRERKVTMVPLDVRNYDKMKMWLESYEADAVCHFAARMKIAEAEREINEYADTNVVGTACVVRVVAELGIKKLLFAGTSAVYDESAPSPVAETAPIKPAGWYGHTKLMAEDLIRRFSDRVRAVLFRFGTVIGAANGIFASRKNEEHLFSRAVKAAMQGEEFTIHGDDWPTADGTCERDYVHVLDIADAFAAALTTAVYDSRPPEVVNLGTGQLTSVKKALEIVQGVVGKPIKWKVGPRRPGDPASYCLDSRRAKSLIGWEAKRPIAEAVKDAWEARQAALAERS